MKKFFLPLLLICGLSAKTLSAELPIKPPEQENRFLFVVDTSLSMNRSAKAVREAVHELIESGMQGQMKPGDTFGLWTFNERLNTEFPMQRWSSGEEKNLAQLAVDFLKKRRYENKSQLRAVLPPLYSVIKSSKAITVILISNGNESIQGTPFDGEINAIFPNYVRELHDAKLAFVTVLVGRNGKPVAYSVNSTLSPIQIPQPIEQEKFASLSKPNAVPQATSQLAAPKPKQIARAVTKPQTNHSANSVATAPVKVDTKPEIKTNEVATINSTNLSTPTNAPIELSTQPVQTSISDLSVPAKIAPSIKAEPANQPSSKTTSNASSVEVSSATNSEASIRDQATQATTSVTSTLTDSQPQTAKPSLIQSSGVAYDDPSTFEPNTQRVGVPVSANLPRPRSGTRPNKMTEHNASPPMNLESHAAAVVASQTGLPSKQLLVAGAVLLLVAGIIVFLLLRHPRKSQPSLISRSIDQSK